MPTPASQPGRPSLSGKRLNRPELLEQLFRFALVHGFSHHSLEDLARPLGVTRGALGHYFDAKRGGIKLDMAQQLLLFAREKRSKYLIFPTRSFQGPLSQKRQFFAQQMALYLVTHLKPTRLSQWNCPAFTLEYELRGLTGHPPKDQDYLELLDHLFGGGYGMHAFQLSPEQIERFVSGPYPPEHQSVLNFFAPPKAQKVGGEESL